MNHITDHALGIEISLRLGIRLMEIVNNGYNANDARLSNVDTVNMMHIGIRNNSKRIMLSTIGYDHKNGGKVIIDFMFTVDMNDNVTDLYARVID